MNIPNLLTLARLLALPAVIVLIRCGHGMAAAGVFLIAMLSDCADGWLARRLGQVSRLGVYLDPIVDKVLVIGLFYEVAFADAVSMAVPHLLLTREFFQSGVRTVGALSGRVVGANWMGKTKAVIETPVLTCAIVTASGAGVYNCNGIDAIGRAGAWCVVAVAWIFFGAFAWRNRALLVESDR
jgi:CDP-diacylglycerol--glycerol-3-phosphate 3-phosphatidyltransferase